jgi:signal transduction histidine kinase
MHDIVSHSLTVMVTLAEGSAAIAPTDTQRAQDGMRRVAETGRSALTDMRRMLGALTETDIADGAQLAPQPSLVDLHDLVERFRTAGLPVRLTSRGTEPVDLAEQLAVYRIVQESLTNALKHAATPTRVEVDVRFTRTSSTITVTDDGLPRPHTGEHGHGLVGMRERVALYGGTLESGPASPR